MNVPHILDGITLRIQASVDPDQMTLSEAS